MEEPQPYSGDGGSEYKAKKGFHFAFIKTPPGILLCLNIIFTFLGWTIIAGWRGGVPVEVEIYWSGRSGFYLSVTLIPWLLLLTFFVLMMLNFHEKLPKIINFSVTMMVNCILWAVLLFVASCVIADAARKGRYSCDLFYCNHLGACAAFGFLGALGMGAEAFLHFREWKSS